MKIWQEFYCNDFDGYINIKINIAINQAVRVVCPSCGRLHPRKIKDGQIYEGGKEGQGEELLPPKSAYSKTPFNKHSRKDMREGAAIATDDDLTANPFPPRSPEAQALISQSLAERFGGKT